MNRGNVVSCINIHLGQYQREHNYSCRDPTLMGLLRLYGSTFYCDHYNILHPTKIFQEMQCYGMASLVSFGQVQVQTHLQYSRIFRSH